MNYIRLLVIFFAMDAELGLAFPKSLYINTDFYQMSCAPSKGCSCVYSPITGTLTANCYGNILIQLTDTGTSYLASYSVNGVVYHGPRLCLPGAPTSEPIQYKVDEKGVTRASFPSSPTEPTYWVCESDLKPIYSGCQYPITCGFAGSAPTPTPTPTPTPRPSPTPYFGNFYFGGQICTLGTNPTCVITGWSQNQNGTTDTASFTCWRSSNGWPKQSNNTLKIDTTSGTMSVNGKPVVPPCQSTTDNPTTGLCTGVPGSNGPLPPVSSTPTYYAMLDNQNNNGTLSISSCNVIKATPSPKGRYACYTSVTYRYASSARGCPPLPPATDCTQGVWVTNTDVPRCDSQPVTSNYGAPVRCPLARQNNQVIQSTTGHKIQVQDPVTINGGTWNSLTGCPASTAPSPP